MIQDSDQCSGSHCIAEGDWHVVPGWNNVALSLIATNRLKAPEASRILAMMHAAVSDASNAVHHVFEPLRFAARPYREMALSAVVSGAAHGVLTGLFRNSNALDEHLKEVMNAVPDSAARTEGLNFGATAADAILAWRGNDHSDEVTTAPFLGGTRPGQWRPTPPSYLPAEFTHWRYVTPFVIKCPSQFRPAAARMDSEQYESDLDDIRDLGAKNNITRTPEQDELAAFWQEEPGTVTEVGRVNQIAQQVAHALRLTIWESARFFAMLNIAMADALIACMDCKYEYCFWRPVTAIHEEDGRDPSAAQGRSTWEPLLVTPAYPDYVSSHSMLVKAGTVVLAKLLGSDAFRFSLDSYGPPRRVRNYQSFSQAAEEASISRIWGGVHFRFSCELGASLGREIGEHVWLNCLRPACALRL